MHVDSVASKVSSTAVNTAVTLPQPPARLSAARCLFRLTNKQINKASEQIFIPACLTQHTQHPTLATLTAPLGVQGEMREAVMTQTHHESQQTHRSPTSRRDVCNSAPTFYGQYISFFLLLRFSLSCYPAKLLAPNHHADVQNYL